MNRLTKDIRNGKLNSMYLFFGKEDYFCKVYTDMITKQLFPEGDIINIDKFEGKDISPEPIIDALETMPFLSNNRLIIVKDSGLFTRGRKDDTNKMKDYLVDIPESNIIIFWEENVDKRNTLYRHLNKNGLAMEFQPFNDGQMKSWIIRSFNEKNINITDNAVDYFLRTVSQDMNTIIMEIEKLTIYVDKTVTIEDIDAITTKSLESHVFNLVAAIGEKNTNKALEIYAILIHQKESPLAILSMIARQFRIILQAKAYKNMGVNQIAREMNLRAFIVRDALNQGRNFTSNTLIDAIRECLDTDIGIKTGKVEDILGIELLIIKYSGYLEDKII